MTAAGLVVRHLHHAASAAVLALEQGAPGVYNLLDSEPALSASCSRSWRSRDPPRFFPRQVPFRSWAGCREVVYPPPCDLSRCRTVFDRFTKRARQVVVMAQEESRSLGHYYIGSEHLLIGLLRVPEGLAAPVLETLGLTLEKVRGEVIRIAGPGGEAIRGRYIPFTPAARKALELALQEALLLGHNYIGAEHILLGLVRANEGVGAQIMLAANLDLDNVRQEVRAVARSAPVKLAVELAQSESGDVKLTSPPLAPELIDELARLAAERQALIDAHKPDEAARLRTREERLRRPAAALVLEWNLLHGDGEDR